MSRDFLNLFPSHKCRKPLLAATKTPNSYLQKYEIKQPKLFHNHKHIMSFLQKLRFARFILEK